MSRFEAILEDKRRHRRTRVVKAGLISFGGLTISCTVRNLNRSGAILNIANKVTVPKEFKLAILPGAIWYKCRIVWMSEKRIGVSFNAASKFRGEKAILYSMPNAGS